jgi:hypothetical protein
VHARSRAEARDAGLRRSRSLTRWVAVGAAGLTAVFAGVAAQAFHGRTVHRAVASSPAAGSSSVGSGGSATGSGTGTTAPPSEDDGSAGAGLQPPPAPPQPSPDPGATASSGS